MKVLTAMVVSAVCWWLGDRTSRLMEWADSERSADLLYPIYNCLMGWSVRTEQWAGIEFLWGAKWAAQDESDE